MNEMLRESSRGNAKKTVSNESRLDNIKVKTWTFKKGDVICESEPYAFAVQGKFVDQICHFCFKPSSSLLRCSACKFTRYCSKVCQKTDWTQHHKAECFMIHVINNEDVVKNVILPEAYLHVLRLFLRVVRRYQKEKSAWASRSSEVVLDTYRDMDTLLSHWEAIESDSLKDMFTVAFLSVAHTSLKIIPGSGSLTDDEINQLIGKTLINSTEIYRDCDGYGTGVYLGTSAIDHSCKPNAVPFFKGKIMQIRAIQDMEVSGIGEIFVSYINLQDVTTTRKAKLQIKHYFDCHCEKCSDPTVAALEEQTRFQTTDKRKQFEKEFIQYKAVRNILLETDQYKKLLKMCESLLKKYPEIIFPENFKYLDILDTCSICCSQLQHDERALEYGLKTLPGYAFYYGKGLSAYGIQLVKIEELRMCLNANKKCTAESLANIEEAMSILSITQDEGSEFFKRAKFLLGFVQKFKKGGK